MSYGVSIATHATSQRSPDLEVAHLAVYKIKHARRRRVDHRVCAQRTADASHHDRCWQIRDRDIANHDLKLARRQHEKVVPVAADSAFFGGDVASRESSPATFGSFVGSRLRSAARPRPVRSRVAGFRLQPKRDAHDF